MTTLPADELVERVRRIADQMERFLGPPEMAPGPDPDDLTDAVDLIEAQAAEISSLRAKLAEADREVLRLRAAISWIEPPFVDDKSSFEELYKRVAMCVNDARFARRLIEGNGK